MTLTSEAPHPNRIHQGPELADALSRRAGEVIRCACRRCGAHVNAVAFSRLAPGCPNCGGVELTPVVGAAPLEGLQLAPLY